MKKWIWPIAALALIGTLIMLNGCTSTSPGHSIPNDQFRLAQKASYATTRNDEGIARLMDLFSDYSAGPVQAKARSVYEDKLFFRDGFKELHDIDALEAYLVHGTEPLRSCTFDFEEPTFDNGDYYLRWVMNVNLNRDPEDQLQQAIGLSHVRLNDAGKVVYQQDYWDPTDILYSRIPVASWLIRKVHARL